MRVVLLVAALALVLVSTAASAQGKTAATGNQMMGLCHSAEAFGQGLCVGFAMAVAGLASWLPYDAPAACFMETVTLGQLRDIMVKYLDDHPEELHYSATSLAAKAFAKAFPCPK